MLFYCHEFLTLKNLSLKFYISMGHYKTLFGCLLARWARDESYGCKKYIVITLWEKQWTTEKNGGNFLLKWYMKQVKVWES